MGVCCSSVVPKYQQHVLALYPDPRSPDEMRTLGGVLAQDDVSKWTMRVAAGDLVDYCRAFPSKWAPAAAMLAKRVRGDLARGRLRGAAIGMQALHALAGGANDAERLALFEGSVVSSMLLCFEHANTELQILAAQCLCTLLQVQEPGGSAGNKQRGDAYAAYSSGIGGGDWSKYQLFYPFVLSMATRNPPPGKLAQISAQAKDLFLDSKERARAEAARSERKRKRVKDLAELELVRTTAAPGAPSAATAHVGSSAAAAAAASSSSSSTSAAGAAVDDDDESSSHSMLRLHISLWRSRYFGLKALDHLLTLNRDHKASLTRLDEIVPVLLTNFPKSRKSIKAVAAEARLHAPLANVDEAYKPFHSSEEKDRAEGGVAATGPALNNTSGNKDGRVVDFAPASFKEELSSRTGITLHHVQLLAYMCFRSLCKLPRITLHMPVLLGSMCAWFDAHQRTVVRTALNGVPVSGGTAGAGAGAASTATSTPKLDRAPSKRKEHSPASDSSPAPPAPVDGPFAWENLYLSSHVFAELLCAHVAFENGSMDLLVVALMQHAQDMDDSVITAAVADNAPNTAANSRRGSKAGVPAEDGAGGLATPSSLDPSSADGTSKTTLAQDFKQLFHPKKKAKSLPAGRSPKLAQIAIVQLLNSILNRVASRPPGGAGGVGAGLAAEELQGTTPGADPSAPPPPPALCLMNFSILLDQLLSLVLAGVRALDGAHKSVAQGLSGPVVALSSGAGGDHELLQAERAAETGLAHSVEYLRLLSTVLPSLLIQKFYSFNDVLQALSSVLQLTIAMGPTNRPLKSALLDTAYSMALGLMRWGCASAAGSAESGRGLSSPLTERQNEARGLGLGLSLGDDAASATARASLSSSSLYESLIQSVLGCIACESLPESRGQAYKILQCVLLTMSGFGGAWTSGPSLDSAALLLAQGGAAGGFSGFNFANLDSLAILSNARSTSEFNNNADGQSGNGNGNSVLLKPLLGGSSSDLVGEEAKGEGNGRRKLQVVLDGKMAEPEPSPSPRAHGASFAGIACKDLRALRIPQILASCLDIQSQIHTNASSGGSAGTMHSDGRGGVGAGAGSGPIATVTLQDHKWILSIIYYEITSCFSAPIDQQPGAPGSGAGAPSVGGAEASAAKDPTAHQIASTILKPRGRGVTSTENISLCFQLLILLLLQKHPGAGVGGGGGDMASSPRDGCASDDLGSVQHELALQLPLLFSVLSFLRSSASCDSDKFNLSVWSGVRLHQFATTYLFFVGRLLLLSVDSHWVRQQTVALEEMLHQVLAERNARGEGNGADLEQTWLFGLGEAASASSKPSGPAAASSVAAASSTLSPSPTPITTLLDSEQLAGILARLLVDPPSSDLPSASSAASSAAAAAAAARLSATPLSMSMHDPAMDEGMDACIGEQRAFLLDANSFEPFALKFLLPERPIARFTLRGPGGVILPVGGTESERENSVSWAPSTMGAGGADGPLAEDPTTGRAGSFFGTLPAAATGSSDADDHPVQGLQLQGHGTPRMQYSPMLRAHMSGPASSPTTLSLQQGSSAFGSSLSTVPQSPPPQQSVAEMLAEMDKQSFQALAATCARTSVKSRDDFTHFMSDLEATTPQATRRPSDAASAHRAAAHSIAALDSSSNGAAATLAHEQKQKHMDSDRRSDASLDATFESLGLGAPLVEEVAESHPDLAIMRPLSASTLQLQFPQLASFDLYLHSEIDQ